MAHQILAAAAKTDISSTEQREKMKNAHWAEETTKTLDEIFKSGEQRLRETVMSDNHKDEELDADEGQLKMIQQHVIMKRNAERGIDNFVASNSFCLNRLLYRGWWNEQDSAIYWLLRIGPGAVGPPGGAHGGALAAVLDQFAGYVAIPLGWCVTGELKMTYKSIVPLEEVMFVDSRVVKTEGRRIVCRISIHSLPYLEKDEKALKAASDSGSEVRQLKEPTNGYTHYIIPPPKTIADAIMIKIPAYKGGKKIDMLPPGFPAAWTFGLDLPRARL